MHLPSPGSSTSTLLLVLLMKIKANSGEVDLHWLEGEHENLTGGLHRWEEKTLVIIGMIRMIRLLDN